MIYKKLLIGLLICLALYCSREMPVAGKNGNSNISFNISVNVSNREINNTGPLAKVNDITRVVVTVSGPDMDMMTKNLSGDGETFTGSISVPKGDNRTFEIKARDAAGIDQFDGSVTQNIQNDNESISIELDHIPANPVTLSLQSVQSNVVVLQWTKNNDPDFDHYRIVRSTGSTPDLNDDKLVDIDNQNTTRYSDYSVEANTTYYYQVWVVDTEFWGTKGNVVNATIPAFSNSQKLYNDDGTFEDYYFSEIQMNGLFVMFTPPAVPCRIDSLHYYMKDESDENGGNYYAVITNSEGTDIFWSLSQTTYPGTHWVNWFNLFDTAADATVYDYFYVGIQYARTNGWPHIGVDKSSTEGTSMLYVSSDNKLYLLNTYGDGFPGNLGIRVSVTLGDGQKAVLYPRGVVSRNQISKKMTVPKIKGKSSPDRGDIRVDNR